MARERNPQCFTAFARQSGKYDFGNFAAGTYTLRIEAAGFVTIEEQVVIETGVTSTKDFAMVGF